HNGAGPDATQTFTLSVNDAPKITSAPGTVFAAGMDNAFTVTTYGLPAPSLKETGALPSRVTFTGNRDGTATLGGTPAAGTASASPTTPHNPSGADPTQTFFLVVGQAPVIPSSDMTVFGVGQAGSFMVTSTGAPVAALSASGALPTGVTFHDNGDSTASLSGT